MRLRQRFQLLTLFLFLVTAVPVWFAVQSLAETIITKWAILYAEKQVLHDKSRLLQPITRELALTHQMAKSPVLLDWARDPDNPDKTDLAMAELERFRLSFGDQNYFFALLSNGKYFHNNRENDYASQPFRYTLDRTQSKDAWFFSLIELGRETHINVNPDPELGLTKLWVDVLLKDDQQVLGVVGTGLDLDHFIDNVVDVKAPGVTNLIINHTGAIQIYRNHAMIDFGSISKSPGEANTIDLLVSRENDRRAIYHAMSKLRQTPDQVVTTFVHYEGRRHLAGIAYLPEIDWYEITLLDLDAVLPFSEFSGILAVYALALLLTLLTFNHALNTFVLSPLAKLNEAVIKVAKGEPVDADLKHIGSGEIGQLLQHFTDMSNAVSEARNNLEHKVQERTQALEQLSRTDALTGLLNRRGMHERMISELDSACRGSFQIGLLWLDMDGFKEINDAQGHSTGDEALKKMAEVIKSTTRTYDVAARWGGDEFLIMVSPADAAQLQTLADRITDALRSCFSVKDSQGHPVRLRASIGGCLSEHGESLDSLLQRGDEALYAAKAAGRDCFRLHSQGTAQASIQSSLTS